MSPTPKPTQPLRCANQTCRYVVGWAREGANLRRECRICGAISLFNLVDGIMLGELAPNQATRLEPGEAEVIMKSNRYVDRFKC